MNKQTVVRKRRYKRWYERERTKRVFRVVAILGLFIGTILCCLGAVWRNPVSLKLGVGYFVCSLVILATQALISKMEHLRMHRSVVKTESSDRQGVALLVVMLLMALLVSLTMEAQVVSGIELRRVRFNHKQWELRHACADAVWDTLHTIAGAEKAGGKEAEILQDQTLCIESPSGIKATVLVRKERGDGKGEWRAYLPAKGGLSFSLEARATSNGHSRRVYCLACRRSSGEVNVLGWAEE